MTSSPFPPLLEIMGVEEAIAAVAAKADALNEGWSEEAFQHLCRFIRKGAIFKAEDVRNFAGEAGLAEPHDRRAWGAVLRRACREKLIIRIGYAQCQNKGAHNRPTTLWQAT